MLNRILSILNSATHSATLIDLYRRDDRERLHWCLYALFRAVWSYELPHDANYIFDGGHLFNAVACPSSERRMQTFEIAIYCTFRTTVSRMQRLCLMDMVGPRPQNQERWIDAGTCHA